MEDGTIDFEPLWNNAINQTSSFIPIYQNCKVKKIFKMFLKYFHYHLIHKQFLQPKYLFIFGEDDRCLPPKVPQDMIQSLLSQIGLGRFSKPFLMAGTPI